MVENREWRYLGRVTSFWRSHIYFLYEGGQTFQPAAIFHKLSDLFVFWLVESSIICKSHRLCNRTVINLLLYCWRTTLCDAFLFSGPGWALFCGTSLSLRLACTQSSYLYARHLWTKNRRHGVFWRRGGRRRSWPMYRWKLSFKLRVSSPS